MYRLEIIKSFGSGISEKSLASSLQNRMSAWRFEHTERITDENGKRRRVLMY